MTHLREWTRPDSYGGASWEGWAPVVGRSRDSDCLEESNYTAAYEILGCVSGDEWVGYVRGPDGQRTHMDADNIPDGVDAVDTRCNHWAVGWVEAIYVRLGTEAADKAEEILNRLDTYLVLDEGDFSEREWDYAHETWTQCFSLSERVDLCRRFGVSIFAARYDTLPADDTGSLFDYLRTP